MAQTGDADMVEYGCNGSLALEPRATGLRLIDGGRQAGGTRRATRPKAGSGASAKPGNGLGVLAVTFALGAALAALLAIPGLMRASSSERALAAAPSHVVTVAEGDTVWSIASQATVDGASAQDVKRWIVEENGIKDSAIHPGERIVVPGSES